METKKYCHLGKSDYDNYERWFSGWHRGGSIWDGCNDHDYGVGVDDDDGNVDVDDDDDGDDDDEERWFSGWHGGSSTLGTDLDAHDFFPPIIEIMRRRIHYPGPSMYSKQHCTVPSLLLLN